MKLIFLSLLSLFLLIGTTSAQSDLDFTNFSSLDALADDMDGINNAAYAGMNVLDWTDASGPTLFRISAGVFLGVGSFDQNPAIGLTEDGYLPAGIGLQAGFGTMGFEAYARYFPETEVQGLSLQVLGFGLKYELSDLIPIPAFPAIAIFADYNTMGFAINASRDVYLSDGVTKAGTVDSGIDLQFSSINIGAMISYDLLLIRVYAKAAYDIGKTDVSWIYATASSVGSVQESSQTGTLDNAALRLAAGVSIFGIKAEVGTRNGSQFAGLGYGIAF
ncbi:MAG TPA: hypothetical protein ENJ15_06065 [Caldithrix abyssi]|uniref:Outer membrane protein beta-barrel domain-containing protein n=1 Tax=Caldithrix abyssi TaxID=187145 RepID=A0A7V5VF88_CALAY|nr:hypothetical protein [Caldithrix abyssi]